MGRDVAYNAGAGGRQWDVDRAIADKQVMEGGGGGGGGGGIGKGKCVTTSASSGLSVHFSCG